MAGPVPVARHDRLTLNAARYRIGRVRFFLRIVCLLCKNNLTPRGLPKDSLITWGKKLFTLLDLCVSSLRRGHANLLCIVPILTDDPRRESEREGAHSQYTPLASDPSGRNEAWHGAVVNQARMAYFGPHSQTHALIFFAYATNSRDCRDQNSSF